MTIISTILIALVAIQSAHSSIIIVESGESVQSALASSSTGDTILVLPGEYHESLRLPNHAITLAGSFLLSGDSIDIYETTLYPDSVSSDTSSCIVITSGNQICQRIVGLTLQNGKGTRTDIFDNQKSGGAVYARNSCVSIESCRILDCKSTFGGGIAAIGPSFQVRTGYVEVIDCLIRGCTAQENGGGLFALSCSLVFENCKLIKDSCFNFCGGIEASQSYLLGANTSVDSAYGSTSSLDVSSCEINLSQCNFLHGTCIPHPVSNSFFHIGSSSGRVTACTFSDNLTEYPGGSIIGNPAPEVTGCVFERISATIYTATVLIGYDDNTQFAYNIIRDNVNIAGGAIQPFQRTTAHIHHNLITGNRSLQANRPSAITCVSNCSPLIDSNRVENNSGNSVGFITEFGEHHWDLSRNWWGHESGPYHATRNSGGQGDTILSDSIIFEPWLVSPPETVVGIGPISPKPPVASTWEIVAVYPNPFNSSFTVSVAGFARNDFEMRIIDLLGRQVSSIHSGSLSGTSLHYKMPSQLATGIYFLVAQDDRTASIVKLVFLK